MDNSLVGKLRDAVLKGNDDEIVEAFHQYAQQRHREEPGMRIEMGSRVLGWPDLAEEMRKRTSFGVKYLYAIKESYWEKPLAD